MTQQGYILSSIHKLRVHTVEKCYVRIQEEIASKKVLEKITLAQNKGMTFSSNIFPLHSTLPVYLLKELHAESACRILSELLSHYIQIRFRDVVSSHFKDQ